MRLKYTAPLLALALLPVLSCDDDVVDDPRGGTAQTDNIDVDTEAEAGQNSPMQALQGLLASLSAGNVDAAKEHVYVGEADQAKLDTLLQNLQPVSELSTTVRDKFGNVEGMLTAFEPQSVTESEVDVQGDTATLGGGTVGQAWSMLGLDKLTRQGEQWKLDASQFLNSPRYDSVISTLQSLRPQAEQLIADVQSGKITSASEAASAFSSQFGSQLKDAAGQFLQEKGGDAGKAVGDALNRFGVEGE